MAKGTCFDNLYRRDDIHLAAFTLYIYIYIYIFFFLIWPHQVLAGAPLVTQRVKTLPAVQETRV